MNVFEILELKLRDYLMYFGYQPERNGMMHCPLPDHNDKKTKSFNVTVKDGKNVWYCFGCGRGGNIFDLAHYMEGLPARTDPQFMEVTVKTLADRFGIKVQEKPMSDEQKKLSLMRKALRIMKENLEVTDEAKRYAEKRLLDTDYFKMLGIGMVDYDKVLRKLRREFSNEILHESGLLHSALFHKRLVFSLNDEYGSPVGFASRAIMDDDDGPKYINNKNTVLYNKFNYLYNFNFAKDYDEIFVVEGYIDVLRLFQNGIRNVVSVNGTAFTENHYNKLHENNRNIVFCMDGDAGGLRAMSRIIDKFSNIYAVFIPNGMDPDEYIVNYSVDMFMNLPRYDELGIRIAIDDWREKKWKTFNYLKEIIDKPVFMHEQYLKLLSRTTGIRYDLLEQELNRLITKQSINLLGKIANLGKAGQKLNVTVIINQ